MTANPASITIPTLLSADEFATLHSYHRMELVKGYPQVLPMPGAQHGKVCMTIGRLIGNHVADNDLGHVMGNDTFIQTGTNPDSVRGADVLFIPYDRLPRDQVPPGSASSRADGGDRSAIAFRSLARHRHQCR